jgi:hypothetical protein
MLSAFFLRTNSVIAEYYCFDHVHEVTANVDGPSSLKRRPELASTALAQRGKQCAVREFR